MRYLSLLLAFVIACAGCAKEKAPFTVAVHVIDSESGATISAFTFVSEPGNPMFSFREHRSVEIVADEKISLRFQAEGYSEASLTIDRDSPNAVRLKMKKTEPNQPIQRNASTQSVSNFESPARRG